MQARPEEFLIAGAELVAEALDRFGRVRFRACGTSMLPAISPGDVVDVEACPIDQFRTGDIVVLMSSNGLVAHRLVSSGHQAAVTRGDALWRSDPPISMARLLGRVTRVARNGSSRSPRTPCSKTARACGLLRNESQRWSRRVRAIIGRVALQNRHSRTST
jgi:hypothetical protein